MMIEYPYQYTPTGRSKRPETGTLRVEIREVSVEDAPVAIRERTERILDRERGFEPVIIEYRWFEDKLWTNHSPADSGMNGYAPYSLRVPTLTPGFADINYRLSREERERMIREWAQETILIAEEVWKPCGEPRYHVNSFMSGEISIYTQHYPASASPHAHAEFSLRHRQEAVEAAYRLAATRGYAKEIAPQSEFEILIPEAVRLETRPGEETVTSGGLSLI